MFFKSESLLDFHLDGEDDACGADSGKGGIEDVRVEGRGACYAGAVGEEEGEGEDRFGDDGEGDTGTVCRGRDHSAQGLLGDRAEVAHGEIGLCEGGMESVESDTGFCGEVFFVDIDLEGGA